MSFVFAGYTLIPFFRTMTPKSFPDDTPKKHFRGFIFRLYCLSLRKSFRKSAKWSTPLRLLRLGNPRSILRFYATSL